MMNITNYPDWCVCPISNEVMDDPVIVDAPCHHTVNRSTLEKWSKEQRSSNSTNNKIAMTCPVCSTLLRSEIFSSPNVLLREAIHEFFRCSHNRTQRKISLHHWAMAQKQLGVHRCALHPDQPSHECLHCIWKDYNIHENDTIKSIVSTMRQYPSDVHIIEQGCTVLANRLAAKEVGVRTELTQRYFVVFLLNTMKEHNNEASSNILYQAFRVLRNLPFWNEEHSKVITKGGGIKLMLEILKLHPKQVQRYGYWFLYGLCHHYNPAVKEVLENDGLSIVQDTLAFCSRSRSLDKDEEKNSYDDVRFEAQRLQTEILEQQEQQQKAKTKAAVIFWNKNFKQ